MNNRALYNIDQKIKLQIAKNYIPKIKITEVNIKPWGVYYKGIILDKDINKEIEFSQSGLLSPIK